MIKLFRYELRRVLLSKLLFMVLLVCLGHGWLTLTTVTIRGTAHTAPFSPWSFGDYLSRLLPLLCLGELCLVSVFTSRRERAAQIITHTTPIDPRRYALIRWGGRCWQGRWRYGCASSLWPWAFTCPCSGGRTTESWPPPPC